MLAQENTQCFGFGIWHASTMRTLLLASQGQWMWWWHQGAPSSQRITAKTLLLVGWVSLRTSFLQDFGKLISCSLKEFLWSSTGCFTLSGHLTRSSEKQEAGPLLSGPISWRWLSRALGKLKLMYSSLWISERLPTPYSGLENSMDCYSPWGCRESDTTEQLTSLPSFSQMSFHSQL